MLNIGCHDVIKFTKSTTLFPVTSAAHKQFLLIITIMSNRYLSTCIKRNTDFERYHNVKAKYSQISHSLNLKYDNVQVTKTKNIASQK